jgi:hypothetical protein
VLGELPSLVRANFIVLDVSQDNVLVGSGSFPVLEQVWSVSDGDVSAYLSFEAGAMPKLQRLKLSFDWEEWKGATPFGMECLPCLQDIKVWLHDTHGESSISTLEGPIVDMIYLYKTRENVCDLVESAFKRATSVHPGHPSIDVLL